MRVHQNSIFLYYFYKQYCQDKILQKQFRPAGNEVPFLIISIIINAYYGKVI